MTKLKIVFAPGSFDEFDGTQEELDELIKTITDFVESDDFQDALENAREMEDDEFSDEIMDHFMNEKASKTIH